MLALYSKNGIWKFLLNVGLEHVFSSQCSRLHLLYSSLYICVYTMMSLFMALWSPNQKTQILYCPSAAPSPTGWRQCSPNSQLMSGLIWSLEQRCLHTTEPGKHGQSCWNEAALYPLYTSCASPPVSPFILAHQGLSWFTQVTQVRRPAKIKLDPPKLALTTIPPLTFVFSHIEGKQQDEVKICIVLFLLKPSNPCSRGTLVLPESNYLEETHSKVFTNQLNFRGKMEFHLSMGVIVDTLRAALLRSSVQNLDQKWKNILGFKWVHSTCYTFLFSEFQLIFKRFLIL